MCGRYTPKTPAEALVDHFGIPGFPELVPRFNIAPSQAVPAVCSDSVKVLEWGFVPSWSKEPKVKFSNIDARCETVATSNAYRGSFRHKRCLLPADGFYEWAPGPPKVPHHFRLADGEPFAFAGIWDSWRDELETCALITTTANEGVAMAHHQGWEGRSTGGSSPRSTRTKLGGQAGRLGGNLEGRGLVQASTNPWTGPRRELGSRPGRGGEARFLGQARSREGGRGSEFPPSLEPVQDLP